MVIFHDARHSRELRRPPLRVAHAPEEEPEGLAEARRDQPEVRLGAPLPDRAELEVDRVVVDDRELKLRLCNAAKDKAVSTVNIKADQNTRHEKVVQAMDVAKVCGIEKLGILHRH